MKRLLRGDYEPSVGGGIACRGFVPDPLPPAPPLRRRTLVLHGPADDIVCDLVFDEPRRGTLERRYFNQGERETSG